MAEVLKLARRTALGKSSVRKLRAEGAVPGIVYGRGREPTPVQMNEEVLRNYLQRSGRVADLLLEGENLKAVMKEIQHDIFTDDILHVDFQLVSMTEKITLPVAVILAGELPFPPDQGSLEQMLTEVDVECLPKDAPEEIKVDISSLEPGSSIHVRDLEVPFGVRMVSSGEEVIATVRRPTVEEEAPPEEVEEAEEPEVVGEAKKEKEEEKSE